MTKALNNDILQEIGDDFMRWLQNFMRGRYGLDSLGLAIICFYFILTLLNIFLRMEIISIIAILLLIYFYFRVLSKAIYKRSQENMKFLRYYDPIRFKFSQWKHQFNDRKIYKYYTCKQCKQKLRVPRGKGKITITCPNCRIKFDKRT